MLHASYLLDIETRTGNSHVDQRLNFKPVAVDAHILEATRPKGVVAIAQVGVVSTVEQVEETGKNAVSYATKRGQVGASSPVDAT